MKKPQKHRKRNFKEISAKVNDSYKNFILENMNDHCLRLAVMHGDYKWHYHKSTDELFVVLEGELKIEIENNEPVILKPGEFINIPAGTIHKTSAHIRTINLTFEKNADDTIFIE